MYYIHRKCVCSLSYPAWNTRAPYYVTWPVSTTSYQITSQLTRFSGRRYWTQNVDNDFLHNFCLKTFLTLRRIQRDIIMNVKTSSCKVPVILVRFWRSLNFQGTFSKNSQISNLTEICPVVAELFHADRPTNTTKLAVAFRNFANAPKNVSLCKTFCAMLHGATQN
jgi:hypothetical protein